MATRSNILAWEIPWTKELGGLQSTGVTRARHDLAAKPPPHGGCIPSLLWVSTLEWQCQFTLPPAVQQGSSFSTCSLAFIVCSSFSDDHSDWYEVIPHGSFDLYFSNNEWCEHLFMCLLAICMSSFEKCLLKFLFSFWLEWWMNYILFNDLLLYVFMEVKFSFIFILPCSLIILLLLPIGNLCIFRLSLPIGNKN